MDQTLLSQGITVDQSTAANSASAALNKWLKQYVPDRMHDAQLQALDERQVKGSSMSFRYYRPDRWVDD